MAPPARLRAATFALSTFALRATADKPRYGAPKTLTPIRARDPLRELARPAGLEPATLGIEG